MTSWSCLNLQMYCFELSYCMDQTRKMFMNSENRYKTSHLAQLESVFVMLSMFVLVNKAWNMHFSKCHQWKMCLPFSFSVQFQCMLFFNPLILFFFSSFPLHIIPFPTSSHLQYKTHYTPPTASARSSAHIIWWPSARLSHAFQKPRGWMFICRPLSQTLLRMQNISVIIAATISTGAAEL